MICCLGPRLGPYSSDFPLRPIPCTPQAEWGGRGEGQHPCMWAHPPPSLNAAPELLPKPAVGPGPRPPPAPQKVQRGMAEGSRVLGTAASVPLWPLPPPQPPCRVVYRRPQIHRCSLFSRLPASSTLYPGHRRQFDLLNSPCVGVALVDHCRDLFQELCQRFFQPRVQVPWRLVNRN